MITNKELTEISLSPTKKDYYQIYNELLELASKISDRWSPESTNESDPGIVLLKALTAVADKINYNIDKNTLEAFMPSATQQESMRKLTEMMGYTMKYYRAATTVVNITYNNPNRLSSFQILFPKFTNIKNEEEDINYVTLEDFVLQEAVPSRDVKVIEGELIDCETNTDNIIYLTHLDDNNRYILPETNIAENGIFIFNIADKDTGSEESEPWKKVDNLNSQLPGTCIYKFGFDSMLNMPYIQFPDDISQIIKDGLRIKYIRTNGISGNVAARILTKLEPPAIWGSAEADYIKELAAEDFSVNNPNAATNGDNPESLTKAYNGYKKTIGTFDTLVTCRDYMNRIYQLTMSDTDTTPLVSNIIVSDIRDDINKSTVLCSFNEYGISYSDVSLPDNPIEHFDLMLYPFKTIYLNTKDDYKNSFKYNAENFSRIRYDLETDKTIAHEFKLPAQSDIVAIKNYLRLKAKITTNKKVRSEEEATILKNIYSAIYSNFNSRNIDFGEEIPYDSILEVIENADTRIKDVNLDEPTLYTVFLTADNSEYEMIATDNGAISGSLDAGSQIYNKLVLRNVLAGRIAAFQYDTDFKSDFSETAYPAGERPNGSAVTYNTIYPTANATITKLESSFIPNISSGANGLKLKSNEVIQFRMPNLKTIVTYPSYVNYYVKLKLGENQQQRRAIPATFISLNGFLNEISTNGQIRWEKLADANSNLMTIADIPETGGEARFESTQKQYGAVFSQYLDNDVTKYTKVNSYTPNTYYYYFEISDTTFGALNSFVEAETTKVIPGTDEEETTYVSGRLYRTLGADLSLNYGYLVDENLVKYAKAQTKRDLKYLYVPITHEYDDEGVNLEYTVDGLGQDAKYPSIGVGGEYELDTGEYLLVNYTDSKAGADGTEKKTVVNKFYGPGTIIKPNFALTDSELYHNNHSWSKTTGFGQFRDDDNNLHTEKPDGMFTLDSNEQICIRDIVKVDLDDTCYIYWIRRDDDKNRRILQFTFDEDYGGGTNNAYTLKEGEYLFYTNEQKTDLAYYGAGSLIVKGTKTPLIEKDMTAGEPSEEDILTYGLAASIPWYHRYELGKLDNENKKSAAITIVENQYITLTEGDTLLQISHTDQQGQIVALDLDNEWEQVTSAKYKFAEDSNPTELPPVNISTLGWKGRSRLNFNLGPTAAQELHEGDSIKVYFKENNQESSVVLEPLIVNEEIKPLAIYSNYPCISPTDYVDVTTTNAIVSAIDSTSTFKLKLASLEPPTLNENNSNHTQILLNNYINNNTTYTKFSFATATDRVAGEEVFTLNINIPTTDKYGLIMFYYVDENIGKDQHVNAYIKSDYTNGIQLYNSTEAATTIFTLKSGMQILKIDKNVKNLHIYADEWTHLDANNETVNDGAKSTIIFGGLDLIKDINPKLNYRYDSSANNNSGLDQLLLAIKNTGLGDSFYYNVPIDNSTAIDLNPLIASDNLAAPETWYDSNNTANKFVISEIDADYLESTGISLTKASRA